MTWAGISIIAAAAVAEAAEPRLRDKALEAWVSGSQFDIHGPLGATIAVRFAPDGSLTGEANSLAWVLGAATDRGRWWINGEKICKQWSVWFHAKPRCIEFSRQGDQIAWRYEDGRQGTATRIAGKPQTPPETPAERPAEKPRDPQLAMAGAAAKSKPLQLAPAPPPPARATPAPPPPSVPASAPVPLRAPAPAPATQARVDPPDRPSVAPRLPGATAVSSSLIVAAPPARRGGATAPALLRVVGVDAEDVLWVRRGPGVEYDEIGSLAPDGRGIELVGPCEAGWCRIAYRGLRGWASHRYLTVETMR